MDDTSARMVTAAAVCLLTMLAAVRPVTAGEVVVHLGVGREASLSEARQSRAIPRLTLTIGQEVRGTAPVTVPTSALRAPARSDAAPFQFALAAPASGTLASDDETVHLELHAQVIHQDAGGELLYDVIVTGTIPKGGVEGTELSFEATPQGARGPARSATVRGTIPAWFDGL